MAYRRRGRRGMGRGRKGRRGFAKFKGGRRRRVRPVRIGYRA